VRVALFLSLGHHEALVRRLSSAFEERRNPYFAFLPEWRSTDLAGGTAPGAARHDARGRPRPPPAQRHYRTRRPLLRPNRKASRFMRLGISSIALQHRTRHPRTGDGG
jgi:GntR family transcriptional regulator/MocR family aminotransferase